MIYELQFKAEIHADSDEEAVAKASRIEVRLDGEVIVKAGEVFVLEPEAGS